MAISASIQALLAGEQVAGSRLNSKLLDEMSAEGLLLVIPRGSRKSYRARDMEALKRFLIDKDESFRIIEANASDSRATLQIPVPQWLRRQEIPNLLWFVPARDFL